MRVFENGCDLEYFKSVLNSSDCGLVICPECGELLGFEREDVKSDGKTHYVICPACYSRVKVSSECAKVGTNSESHVKDLGCGELKRKMGKALAFGKFVAVKGGGGTLIIDNVCYKPTKKAIKKLGNYEDALNKGYDEAHAFLIAFYSDEYEW